MARFLAVVLGALIGLAVVWFGWVQPHRAAQQPGSPAAATTGEASASAAPKAPPAPPALKDAEVADALAALTSDDDIVRGSAIEQWGAKVQTPDGKGTIERIALQPALLAALRDKLASMPEDRLILYVEAWGPTEWWIENFAQAHGRYAAWRASADDPIWIPYAYDQLDRFNPETDLESIRAIHEVLLKSSVSKVRRRTLESAAHYFGADSRVYALAHLKDPDNAVARLSWIIVAKTGDIDTSTFDWPTGPRFVGEAVLYALALHDPEQANAVCDFVDSDPVIGKWYHDVVPFIRDRASGKTDRETIVTANPGQGPARIFEEAIRVDELLSGAHPEYVQE